MRRIVILAAACLLSVAAHAATFVVNSTGDAADAIAGNGVCATAGSVCTFRAALNEANALAGADTINFGIAGVGPHTISPASPLPITSSVVIDGTTQPGSGAGPSIVLDGANVVTIGLEFGLVSNSNITIQGLAIGRFTQAGIKTNQTSTTVTIKRCYIGVGADGLTDMGNGDGIWAIINDLGGSSLIVGDASGGGNVISGNQDMGIEIEDDVSGAKLGVLTMQGNIIGLAADGMTSLPNLSGGIRTDLQFGTSTIGGSIAGRNIISGNGGSGYFTNGFFQTDTFVVSHNYVGVAQDGITARGNNGTGMVLVGRAFTIESNIIAANTGPGLSFATGNLASTIRANRIGVALDGSARGNGGAGIVWGTSTLAVIGGPGADQNLIANNGGAGIRVSSGQVEIAENSILNNGSLGIDIGTANVVDANDTNDVDSGFGNNIQNRPQIGSAIRAGGVTFLTGSLSSTPSTTFRIRLFASTTPDPTGFGEGEIPLGEVLVTTSVAGNTGFNLSTPLAPVGVYVTATATSAGGDTSEFSNALLVSGPQQFRFSTPSGSVTEAGTLPIVVERVNGSAGTAAVDITTDLGSASAADFTPINTTLTFANGETTKTTTLVTTHDVLDEGLESFNLVLSNATGGAEVGSPGTMTIHIGDDDPSPSVSIGDASIAEGNSGTALLTFNVTLSAPSERPITVDYATSNGTAIAGGDYAASAGTLTFMPLQTSKPITVQITGDTVTELDETLFVTLSNPDGATMADGSATGTITNDDDAPSITIDDVAIVEGDAGISSAIFTLALSGPTTSTATVNWSTSSGTATASVDYEAASGVATFAPGAMTTTIAVTINGDALVEDNETFFVDLDGPSNATLADAQGGGTIADDDGTPSLSINDPAVVEGITATFTVTLAPASALPVTVSYATSDLTAGSSDYTGASSTLTFAAGETSKTIDIVTLNDVVAESTEQFRITLSAPSGAIIGDAIGTATIIDDDGLPRITIGNVTAAEGNAGSAIFNLTVDLSHASATAVDVDYSISDGTATSGSGDYTAGSGTLTFVPGDTSETIQVMVAGDTLIEPDETFLVTLADATNAIIIDGQATGTITNDDGAAQVSIGDMSASEDSGALVFAVTLNAASEHAITVPWASADGTATTGSDYTGAAGSIAFAPGDVAETVSINLAADTAFEPNETFFVNLLGATNASLADAQAVGTIVNDDAAPAVPAISIAPASVTEGDGGTTAMVFAVTLSVPTVNSVIVNYLTTNATAVAGSDYVSASGSLIFAPGVTAQSITVPILGDLIAEGNETLTVTLSSPTNGTLGTSVAIGTIVDDDVTPSISIAPASVVEGDVGTSTLAFAVTLSVPSTSVVTVSYATSDATALAGADYAATSGTLTFTPGMTTQNLMVPVLGDALAEGNETLSVTLSMPANATLAAAIATGTILDDDVAPAVPSISIANANVAEGDAGSASLAFAVQLNTPTTATVTVSYATSDGSATAAIDYVAANGTLTFAPGVTTQSIVVPVLGDETVETNETLTVMLAAPSNGTLGTATATGTIVEDDIAPVVPSISISNASIVEGNTGSRSLTFVAQLDAPTLATVTVNYLTSNGSATASSDYVGISGTLTFNPGVTMQNIIVPVLGDTIVEGDETFTLTLGTVTATGTIVDDDSLPFVPAISIADVSREEGDAGATLFNFPIVLNTAGTVPITVAWTTVNGSATSGDDFIGAAGIVAFAPGMTAQTISVAVHGDELAEGSETFTIQLTAATNATLADAVAVGTIVNDDQSSPALPSLNATALRVAEGTGEAVVTLTLSARATGGAAVRWMTRGGTATGAADFTEASGRTTFGSNTTATISIPILADAIDESDETFVIELFDADGLILATDRVVITIVDDDETGAQRAIVMAVGSLRGDANSRFGTAVQMVNFSDAPATGALIIRPAGMSDSSRDVSLPYTLGPNELRAYGDLLADHGLEGLATLDVVPATGVTPRLTVRIYDDGSGHGTTGFTLPAVTPSDALLAGDRALLIAPADPIAMRFNIGIRTLDAGATITIETRSQSGATRNTVTRNYAPNWFNQMPAIDFTGIALGSGDYLVLHVTRGSAILYGASVDNATNDPSVQVVMK